MLNWLKSWRKEPSEEITEQGSDDQRKTCHHSSEKHTSDGITSDLDIQKKQFERMLGMANRIFEDAQSHQNNNQPGYKHPIFSYIKLLGMKLQTAYITSLLYEDDYGEQQKYPAITPWLLFFGLTARISLDGKSMYDVIYNEVQNKSIEVELNKDLVLPWPWHISRYLDAISSIGASRPWGEWQQDPTNHSVQVFLPMGICIVEGGNHSITSGILNGEGKITVNDVYDISDIFQYVYTDGIHYKRMDDHSVISKVVNLEFAVIFEIGRLMLKHGVSR